MSVKCYIYPEVQEYKKGGTGNLLFGIENESTYKLPTIYDAFAKGSTASVTSVTAVKIDSNKNEISRTSLATNLIIYDSSTLQYITDTTKILATELDECIYFIEFENGLNKYQTAAFLVQEMDIFFTADTIAKTADSTVETVDQTNITL